MNKDLDAFDDYAENIAKDLIAKGPAEAKKWFEENRGEAIAQIVYSEYKVRMQEAGHVN